MGLRGEQEAILVAPPGEAEDETGSGGNRVRLCLISDPAAAAVNLNLNQPSVAAYFSFKPDVACFIAFGTSGVVVLDSGWIVDARETFDWYCEPGISDYVRVLKHPDSDDGAFLRWYCSQPFKPSTT